MIQLIQILINKIFSARFILTVLIGGTLCVGFINGKVQAEAFVGIATYIVHAYFDRKDRENEAKIAKNP